MFPLVDPTAFHQVITVGCAAALEAAVLHQLPQRGLCADGGLLALAVRLPEADIVGELVRVTVEALLALLAAPHPDAVAHEPFHHEGRLVRDASDAVEHEHQQDIKLALSGVLLDDLELVPVLCPDFVAGHAVLLFLVDDDPAVLLRKAVALPALHGDVRLVAGVVVYLLAGGHAV